MLKILSSIINFDHYGPTIAAPNWLRRRYHWTRKWRLEFFFAVYDCWVGIFPNTKNKAIYICYLPMLGIRLSWAWH